MFVLRILLKRISGSLFDELNKNLFKFFTKESLYFVRALHYRVMCDSNVLYVLTYFFGSVDSRVG